MQHTGFYCKSDSDIINIIFFFYGVIGIIQPPVFMPFPRRSTAAAGHVTAAAVVFYANVIDL